MAENLQQKQHAKTQVDRQLARLEEQIYTLEAEYLDDTANAGNVVVGFENYLKKQNPTTSSQRNQKRKFKEEERLFSRSSVTAPNSTWSLEADADNAPPSKKGRKGSRQKRGGSHKRKGNDYVYSSDSEYEGY